MEPQIFLPVTFLSAFLALCLVGLNGFFVAAEFAIVKVRRTRLQELAGQGIARARISLLCVDELDEYLSATQLGITISSLALGWIGENAIAQLLVLVAPEYFADLTGPRHLLSVGISFFIVTMLHVVLGELVPKSMAIQNAEKITLLVSAPLRFFYLASKPLINMFTWVANAILRVIGYANSSEPPLTENELKLVMKESKDDGVISDSEAQIITRAFEFSDKRAIDIMVSKEQVDYISLSRSVEENLASVQRRMHTRLPVCEKDFSTVVGIVHMKDVWPKLAKERSNKAFEESVRPPIFVSSNLRQDQLMRLFQSCRAHLAVVRDAGSGKNVGIVTLEDILESLVGEIRDEHGN